MAATGGGEDDPSGQGPFGRVAADYGDLVELLEAFSKSIGKPGPVEVAERVLELPPEERFERSIERFKTVYGLPEGKPLHEIEPGDWPAPIASVVERVPADQLVRVLLRLFEAECESSVRDLYEELLVSRGDETGILLAAVFLEKIHESAAALEAEFSTDRNPERTRRYLSVFVAISAHLLVVVGGERESVTEDLLRDVLRVDYHVARIEGRDPGEDPADLDQEEVEARIRLLGAVSAYERLDITVSRGAELAGVPVPEFEDALLERGVRPRYGPESGEELLEGPGLSKQGR